MSRQLVGGLFCFVAAWLYLGRHLGAMLFVSNKNGNLNELYEIGLTIGGTELLPLSVLALVVGIGFVVWGEYASYRTGRRTGD